MSSVDEDTRGDIRIRFWSVTEDVGPKGSVLVLVMDGLIMNNEIYIGI